jgi:histidinol phosphatase-like PHP family hydrolase
MLIALDYDKTYTADKVLWNKFIQTANEHGHKIICFTMRYPDERILNMPSDIEIHYTSRKAKKVWAEQNGFLVDIWIDDRPAWLFEDSL